MYIYILTKSKTNKKIIIQKTENPYIKIYVSFTICYSILSRIFGPSDIFCLLFLKLYLQFVLRVIIDRFLSLYSDFLLYALDCMLSNHYIQSFYLNLQRTLLNNIKIKPIEFKRTYRWLRRTLILISHEYFLRIHCIGVSHCNCVRHIT